MFRIGRWTGRPSSWLRLVLKKLIKRQPLTVSIAVNQGFIGQDCGRG